MRVVEVEYQNFLSIRAGKIKLDNGLYLIRGTNVDSEDGFDANGAGKTSILEGIVWGLYGKTLQNRTKDDIPHRYGSRRSKGNTQARINLLNSKDEEYIIIRTMKELRLISPDGEITRGTISQTQEYIDMLMGKSYDMFLKTSTFTPASIPFSKYTDSEAKEFFNQILDLDRWDNYRDTTKERLASINEAKTKRLLQIENATENITKLQTQSSTLISEIDSLKSTLKQLIKGSETTRLKADLKSLKQRRENCKDEQKTYLKLRKDVEKAKDSFDKVQEDWNELNVKITSHKNVAHNLRTEAKGISSELKLSICIHCHKPQFSDEVVDTRKKMMENLMTEAEQRQKKFNELEPEYKDLTQEVEQAKEKYYDLRHTYHQLTDQTEAIESFTEAIDEAQSELDAQNLKIEKLQERINVKWEVHGQVNEQIDDLYAKIKDFEKKAQTAKNLQNVYENLIEAFGNRGIKSSLMQGLVSPLERLANTCLRSIGVMSFNIKVKLSSETKKGLTRNKFNIKLVDLSLSKEIDYSCYSGGERKRIDMALILALLKISSGQHETTLLAMDEIIDAVDQTGGQSVVDILKEIAVDKTILVISHNPIVYQLFNDNIINAIKEGYSTRIVQ